MLGHKVDHPDLQAIVDYGKFLWLPYHWSKANEIKVKGQRHAFWMALAMTVSTRLWLGGAINPKRDLNLIQALAKQVRQVALCRNLALAFRPSPPGWAPCRRRYTIASTATSTPWGIARRSQPSCPD